MQQMIDILLKIPLELNQYRLDQALSLLCVDFSRSQLQHWIREGLVQVDKAVQLKPRTKVLSGQQIEIHAIMVDQKIWEAENIPLNIIYADADLIIIDKPPGMVVHPGAGNPNATLVNALINYDPLLATLPRAGIIHRLDKNTSGLLVIARNLSTHFYLVKAMQERQIKREYLAVVKGIMISGGTIKTFFGRHPQNRTKMSVLPTGKIAITHYRIHKRFNAHTLVQVQLETGRTHQIRVHLAHLHYPIVGDPEYGKPSPLISRQALHAERLTFSHPRTHETMSWQSPIPKDMQELINHLQ